MGGTLRLAYNGVKRRTRAVVWIGVRSHRTEATEATGTMSRKFRCTAALVICVAATLAHAQVYKCTDASGKTTYGDTACDAAARPLKLPPEPTKGAPPDPRVCEQLLDETRRLAQEAERTVARGGKESAESLQRRQKVTKQYEQRCAAISRSEPKP